MVAFLSLLCYTMFGDIIMNCENVFCIYNDVGFCILDEIDLDFQGQCKACIQIDIDDDELMKLKKEKLLKFYND